MLHHLVHLGIPPWEKAVRTVTVYAAILGLLHLSGKRSLAQLNSFDLVVLLLLSNVVQNAIIGPDDSLLGGLLGAVILIALNYAVVRATFMSPRLAKLLQGSATTVSEDGKIDEAALAEPRAHARRAGRGAPPAGARARGHREGDARAGGRIQRDAEAETLDRRRDAQAERDRGQAQLDGVR